MKKDVETMDDWTEEYFEDCKLGGEYPTFEVELYTSEGDQVTLFLETDDIDGEKTRKAAGFIEILLNNGIAFDMSCGEGGIWWDSTYAKYREYKERKKKKELEGVGDDE